LTRLFENPRRSQCAATSTAQVDRDTLVAAQSTPRLEEQVNQVINQVQTSIRDIVITASSSGTDKSAKFPSHSGRLPAILAKELNPEGIKRDLQLLLNDPRAGGRVTPPILTALP